MELSRVRPYAEGLSASGVLRSHTLYEAWMLWWFHTMKTWHNTFYALRRQMVNLPATTVTVKDRCVVRSQTSLAVAVQVVIPTGKIPQYTLLNRGVIWTVPQLYVTVGVCPELSLAVHTVKHCFWGSRKHGVSKLWPGWQPRFGGLVSPVDTHV